MDSIVWKTADCSKHTIRIVVEKYLRLDEEYLVHKDGIEGGTEFF